MMLSIVIWVGLALCLVPAMVFSCQVFTAWAVGYRGVSAPHATDLLQGHAAAVLIPAHNESLTLAETLAPFSLQPSGMLVLVVADNCTDDTAAVARACGIEVIERFSTDLRGKGYALQFGLDHLKRLPHPQVVIVLDADCLTTAADMVALSNQCFQLHKPVQGVYRMHAPPGASVGTKISAFAWLVKTQIRPSGWRWLGRTCQLMGSGFALPWSVASTLELASGHIVEDLKLTLDLARQRNAPVFRPCASVTSFFPSAAVSQATQRRRWEHGHLGLVLSDAPRALAEALLTRNPALLAVALDIVVPPLSLLVMSLAALALLASLQFTLHGVTAEAVLACALASSVMLAVVLAWLTWGRSILTGKELLSVPGFVLGKLGVYVGFVRNREHQWTRTDRD